MWTTAKGGYPRCDDGGRLGTRLYPYTKILPKPLIPVGEQPIAELIFPASGILAAAI